MSENEIVISGMSGRFPESRNIDELSNNLYNGIDMVTNSEDRWPDGTLGFTNRMGRIPDMDCFDTNYFGIMGQLVEILEPQSRLLLEVTHEAIIDAGINPQSLRGTKTGVYIGMSKYSLADGFHDVLQSDNVNSASLVMTIFGNMQSLIANRVSYIFDFKGPSLITDTACSASLTAFTLAMNDLNLGHIDYAIVGGTQLTLQPFILQMQQEISVCSPRGISAVLDESADGFVKSDAVACLLLQRRSTAKRVYAKVLTALMNNDGKKSMGMFFPSSEAQESLMITAYKQAGIDPLKMTYFEGHLTGTKAGDPQEVEAIYKAYCEAPGRKDPLPLGFVKSNIGHTEGCSGIASIVKVMISYENEKIPPNINLKQLKHECEKFCPPLYPNTEVLDYEPGMAGINNFGIGGVNAHVLVEPNYKLSNANNLKIAETIPRIVNICGRTEESVRSWFDFIENNPNKISRDFLALLTDTMKQELSVVSAGFPFRGSMIIKKSTEVQSVNKYEFKKQLSELKSKVIKPIWFLFPGIGGQWPAMAKALMPIKIFADKIEECHQILAEFGVNLKHFLLCEDKEAISTMTAKCCATTSIELALFEVLKALDITPDGIIGHSFGEIACAYADGCLTTRQTLFTTYIRGVITENDKHIPKGLMAVCGLNKAEAEKLISPEVNIACYNGKDTVVFSGAEKQMKELMSDLKQKNIFVYQLDSGGIPCHSHYLQTSAQPMIDRIKEYIPNPIKRSEKWISTSILRPDSCDDILRYCSAEYFVHNLISPVFFYEKFKHLPSDAIVIEIGPHAVFRKIVKDTLEDVSYLSLMKKDSNETNLDNFLTAIATLYELGLNPSIENLYPKVQWPVSRGTPSIGALMKWDHRVQFERNKYPDHYNKVTASDMNVDIDLTNSGDQFYSGHCVDGNVIFPATGYLMLAWRQFSATLSKSWNEVPVVFEDCQFRRPVYLSPENKTKLKVRYDQHSGEFHVLENDNVCALGKIRSPTDDTLLVQHIIHEKQNCILENEYCLETEDIYKELRCTGLDYTGEFQRLKQIRTNDFNQIIGICKWNGNLVTFLESMFQALGFSEPHRKLQIPVLIKSIRIDPNVFLAAITQNKIVNKHFDSDYEIIANKIDSEVGQLEMGQDTISSARVSRAAKYCLFEADMPFYYNSELKLYVTHGIEVEGLIITPIARRLEKSNLVLDSYQFIANDDNNAIEEYDRKNTLDYIEICKSMAGKLKQMGVKELNCDFDFQILTDELLDKYKQMDSLVMLEAFAKISDSIDVENNNPIKLTPNQIKSIVEQFDLGKDMVNIVSKNERLIRTMTDIVCENYTPKREVTVTEINLTPDLLVKEVEQNMSHYQIIPTFVDYNLIVRSKDYINKTFNGNSIVWNENEELNLKPSDLIIFRDSFDFWSIDLKDLMQKLKNYMITNGFLLIVSKYQFTEPELALNSVQNRTEIFNNSNLKVRYNQILKIVKELGLTSVCEKYDNIGNSGLLFRKVNEMIKIPEKSRVIEITGERDEKWFQLLKENLKSMRESDNKTDNIWLIAKNKNINGILGLMNCLRLEPGGDVFRCIFDFNSDSKQPIDWKSKPFSDILHKDLVINVIKDGKLGTYRHLKLAKDSNKVVSNEYFLNLGQTRDLSSLQWFDLKNIKPNEERYDLNGNRIKDVPICIYSTGLTFHDVMVATGRIPPGDLLLYTDCLIGCEFAGRRADTGERVMGFEMSRCFATSINANVDMISHIPDHWSMDDSITILSTYSTVWYGLIERAGLKRGESILIHSGAGGVGQSAINICKHYNCDIYVTVGTEEKKRFLMNQFNIPENRIFSSRNIDFKQKIKELTKGKGVDLVLNSLSGEKLDASYGCLADSGRFVELGKYDMVLNKKLGMFDFLRDISFIGVAVDMCLMIKQDFAIRFFDWMHKNCNNGCVKPINKTVFNANEADKAFRYMTTGKHIGKIVIKMRDEEINTYRMTVIKSAEDLLCISKTYFDPNKAYIITGGLGGFGLELVHWMLYMGARKFVLSSRSGIKTDYQRYKINQLINYGKAMKYFNVNIIVSKNDCMTTENTRRVISDAKQLGQIGGIFHLTLVLKNGLFQDMTFERFCDANDSKYIVANNLDVETRKLGYKLDYFVVFSSVACGKGSAGQTNYGFGNSLCERICEQRREDGLHGLAIQYGPIGDVGAMSEKGQSDQLINLQKQRINSCCDVLDKLLAVDQSVVTSFVKSERTSNGENTKKNVIKDFWKALAIDPESTPEHLTLSEIGLESMFAVELQQELEREYNVKIGLNHIKLITIKNLKDYESGKTEILQNFLDDAKKGVQALSRYKFVIPVETHTQLNSIKTGKPIYFMPPFEITFSGFEELAKKFDRPVIGLNWTKDMINLKTIKDITSYYTDLLKVLEPNGKYDLVGYFDGALVVSKLLLKGLINKSVIIDIIDDRKIKEGKVSDEVFLRFVLGFMSNDLSNSFIDKLFRSSNSEPDLHSKIRRLIADLKDFVGSGIIATDMEEIFQIAFNRLNIVSEYMSDKRNKHLDQLRQVIGKKWTKKTGKIKFIKPFQFDKVDDPDELIDDTRDLYFLPNENESKDVVSIEGVDSLTKAIISETIVNKILAEFK